MGIEIEHNISKHTLHQLVRTKIICYCLFFLIIPLLIAWIYSIMEIITSVKEKNTLGIISGVLGLLFMTWIISFILDFVILGQTKKAKAPAAAK